MNNSTFLPENDGPLNSPGFMAYCIILAVVTLVAVTMAGMTILALLKATSIPGPVRLFLINLLFAGLLVAVAMMFMVGSATVLINASSDNPRPLYLCRVYLWAFGSGVVARLWSPYVQVSTPVPVNACYANRPCQGKSVYHTCVGG